MAELKPCPFCGGESEVKAAYWDCHGEKYESGCANPQCLVHPYSDLYDTEEEAIEAWNTRYERTCTIEGVEYDDLVEEFYFDLSCGHVYWGSLSEPPKFCVECGAKVVEE